MDDYARSFIQKLVTPVNSEELKALLDSVISKYNIADWQLLQRQVIGSNHEQFKICLKADGLFFERQDSHHLLDTLLEATRDPASINVNHEIISYWSFSSKRNKFLKVQISDKKKYSFDYATLKLPILNGIEYALIFASDGNDISSDLTEIFVLASLIAWRSISVFPDIQIGNKIKLGNRERQVLSWTSQGKTSYEISKILNLSEHTINNYVTNAANKLGTNNRVHTVCRAVVLGLI